jgi:hypothetical protein
MSCFFAAADAVSAAHTRDSICTRAWHWVACGADGWKRLRLEIVVVRPNATQFHNAQLDSQGNSASEQMRERLSPSPATNTLPLILLTTTPLLASTRLYAHSKTERQAGRNTTRRATLFPSFTSDLHQRPTVSRPSMLTTSLLMPVESRREAHVVTVQAHSEVFELTGELVLVLPLTFEPSERLP